MKSAEAPDYDDSLADIIRGLNPEDSATQVRGFHYVIPPHVMTPGDEPVVAAVFFVMGDEAHKVGTLIGQYVDALAEHANTKAQVAAHSPSQ